jgi:hypothetical protein
MSNGTGKKKPTSAADFRKADIAATKAFNVAGDQPQAPSFSAGTTGAAEMGGTGVNDLFALANAMGWGKGGGGGGTSTRGLDRFISSLNRQIKRGPDVSALTNLLSGLKTSAGETIGSAYEQMTNALGGITNPFAGYQAQAVSSPTAGLEQFLASQGTGTDDLTRFAQLQQAQSQQQAQAANNLMAQLGGLFSGAQQSRQAEMAQGRAADLGSLALNEMLLNAQIQQQGKSDIDKLREMLLQAQIKRAGL